MAAMAVDEPDITSGMILSPYFWKYPPSTAASTGALVGVIDTRPA